MSISFVLVLAALGLAGVAALALLRPRKLALADAQSHPGGRRPAELATLCAPWLRWLGARVGRPSAPAAEDETALSQPARVPVMGYATFSDDAEQESDDDLAKQAEVIARACGQRGLVLLEMVGDPHHNRGPIYPRLSDARPGLRYALDRIAAGEAQGLVVPGLRRLTPSVAELGPIVEWCTRHQARLVAVAQGFDTGDRESRIAARLLIEVSRWERERLSGSLLEGQSPSDKWATSAVVEDDPDLLSRSGGESS
jgi:hypothetical protein